MDFARALSEFFTGLIRTGKMVQGFKVIVSVLASALTSFMGGCGFQLYHEHASWPVAIGYGLLVSAGAINSLFVLSPMLRGFAIATFTSPKGALVDISNYQVTDRSKEK